MAEPGSLLDYAELEGIRVTVEIAAYDILLCTGSLALPLKTAFSSAYRFDNGLTRGVYQTKRDHLERKEKPQCSGEESIGSIGAEGRWECIGDVQLRGLDWPGVNCEVGRTGTAPTKFADSKRSRRCV